MKSFVNRGSGIKKPAKIKTLGIPKGQNKSLYILTVLSGLGLMGTILIAITTIFVFTAFSSTLPSPSKLTNRQVEQSTKIFDRNGVLLYSVFQDKDRTLVKIGDVTPYLLNATLAAEDADFYLHQGIDPLGIARSVLVTLTGQGKHGGSTLTQQVAKNALLTPERTVSRKIKDVVLALQIEKNYSKDEILQMYLNEVPYGGTTWGAQAASKTIFNKSAADLTLAEAALIAGLPQRPTYYSPFNDPEIAKNRQRYVLKLMHERGWVDRDGVHRKISDEEYNQAIEQPLVYASIDTSIKAPHFIMYVLQLLREKYGDETVDSGGLKVTTSLDINVQEEFQAIVKDEVTKAAALDLTNAGLIALEPKSRNILAMVGSIDYFSKDISGQFNVTTGRRQPGSSLKPFTYLTGLIQGYTAASLMYDVQTEFPIKDNPTQKSYAPQNYGNWGFRGPIQVRYALANSVNSTAVKMLDLVGIPNMVKLANDLGVKSLEYNPTKIGLSIALGGGEVSLLDMTNGYASLADGGYAKDPVAILEITDTNGKVLEKNVNFEGRQVADPRAVWIITDILSDNNARTPAFGGRSQLYIPLPNKAAVKTGTSNDLKDNWTLGFTPDITIGVWVGNNDGTQMNVRLASGLTGAAPIWNRAISYYLKDHPNPEFPKPEGVVTAWVGTLSGMDQYEDKEDRRVEYFVEGTEPKSKSDIFQRVKICDDGKIEDKLYIVYTAEKPEWQKYVDAWIDNKYKDDTDSLYTYRGPDYEKEKNPERFDLDHCEEDKKKD